MYCGNETTGLKCLQKEKKAAANKRIVQGAYTAACKAVEAARTDCMDAVAQQQAQHENESKVMAERITSAPATLLLDC